MRNLIDWGGGGVGAEGGGGLLRRKVSVGSTTTTALHATRRWWGREIWNSKLWVLFSSSRVEIYLEERLPQAPCQVGQRGHSHQGSSGGGGGVLRMLVNIRTLINSSAGIEPV